MSKNSCSLKLNKIVMATHVTGEILQQNYELQTKFNEFYRQINQNTGYPYEFKELMLHLQRGVEGKFQNPILERVFKDEPLLIDACDGTETFSTSEDTFKDGIDEILKTLEAKKASKATGETLVNVHQILKDVTHSQVFGLLGNNLEKLCLTQHQIIKFCQKYQGTNKKFLSPSISSTRFLFKIDDEFVVAYVSACRHPYGLIVSRENFGKNKSGSSIGVRHVVTPVQI